MQQFKLWQPQEPISTFFFDCDGTLSLIEGIDVLAVMNHRAEEVQAITKRCMSITGLTSKDYQRRLECVQPTTEQINLLAELYIQHCTPGAREITQALQQLNKTVYIISAGIKEAVLPFAKYLGIAYDKVLAVDIYFDEQGHYKGFDESSNMVRPNGKTMEIASLLDPAERALLVGDGVTDLEARDAVTRFVGFAGLNAKEQVRENADFYINTHNLFALFPLGLTQTEVRQLSPENTLYYERGLADITNSLVLLQENRYVYHSST